MNVLRDIINEFAVFDMPTPRDEESAMDDDTSLTGDNQDDVIKFGVDMDDELGDDEEMDCECNCPHHKKFDDQPDEDSLEANPNIEVVDRDNEVLDDEEDDATKDFKLF